jgi:hypothetical protein
LLPAVASALKGDTNRNAEAKARYLMNSETLPDQAKLYSTFNLTAQASAFREVHQNLATKRSDYIDKEELVGFSGVRKALLGGERMAVCFSRVSALDLAGELTSITGLEITVDPEGATTLINYSGKGVTLKEMLAQMSTLSGVHFSMK